MRRKLSLVLFLTILTLFGPVANATTYTSAQDGPWNNSSTWSPSTNVPQSGDIVIINHNIGLSVSSFASYAFRAVIVNSGATLTIDNDGYLTIAAGIGLNRELNVHGTLIISDNGIVECQGAPVYCDGVITVNAQYGGFDAGFAPVMIQNGGILNMNDGVFFASTFGINTGGTLNANGGDGVISAGSATIAGNVTSTGTFTTSNVITCYTGSLAVSGSIGVGATSFGSNYYAPTISLTPGSEVRYLAAGAQNIDVQHNYYNLTLEGSGNKSIASNLTVNDNFRILDAAAFLNPGRSVNCGSSLLNNSSATHSFGSGTYTFTGTTIGGSGTTSFANATVNFGGSSIVIGDGDAGWGDGNITFKNVSFSNASSDLVIGANGYAGTVSVTGLLSMTGSNAAMTVYSGTLSLNNLSVSGAQSTVDFEGGSATHAITGNVTCGNDLIIGTPVGVGGSASVTGDLFVASEFDVTGTVTVLQTLEITGSGSGTNTFGGAVTVSGTALSISGGSNHFSNGLTHNTTAAGSTCSIGGTLSTGNHTTTVTLNAETVELSGLLAFNRLAVTNPNGSFTATSSFTVSQILTLAKDLGMTGYSLTFPATAPQSAIAGTGEVIGTVHRTLQATGTYMFNGQYITLLIPNLAMAEEYEFKLAKVAPDQQAVTRCYDIRRVGSDLTPGAWLYTLGLYYKDSELNGNQENTLMLAHGVYDTAGEDQFTKLSASSVNTNANIVTFVFDGITSFNHRYAIADLNSPLPVELQSFSARRKDRDVQLRWKTATEINNFGFEVERAETRDGEYRSVGFVEGHGTKNSPSDYRFDDAGVPAQTLYYRLRQIDRDGEVSYSPVVEVAAGGTFFEMSNYPNPFNPSTVITFQSPADGRAVLTVYNTLGETVAAAFDADVRSGETVSVPFDAGDLPGGVYFYAVNINGTTQTGKMLLNK